MATPAFSLYYVVILIYMKVNASLFKEICNYFGGARSNGFATLRNVSKLQFFDRIGHAKSVGFRFYSAF